MLARRAVVLACVQAAAFAARPQRNVFANFSTVMAAGAILEGIKTTISESRIVDRAFENIEQGEGRGARVRRSLGTRTLRNLDPFLMLDFFTVSKPAGFPDHPHRGFETVTYMVDGEIAHEDFAGHQGTIGPGSLQWMTAGKGIVHCEMPMSDVPARGLQLWVNLKAADKMVEPAYQELSADKVPKVKVGGVSAAVIAGECLGVSSPVRTRTPTMYLDILLEPGSSIQQPIPSNWNAFAYVLSGKPSFSADGTKVDEHHTVLFSKDDSADGISISAPADESARVVLIAGQPIGEPVVQHGPFVMNTQEEIMAAMNDFSRGQNGFERARGWHSKTAAGSF